MSVIRLFRVGCVIALFLGLSISAMATDIHYFNQSWEAIRQKAKAEHKYIFIDAYTDWCSWCKVMDKETMIDPAVVQLLNDKFISVKMDMEHGEGVSLAMKYHVSGYPTFLFFNPEGRYVYQAVGYLNAVAFAEQLQNAMAPAKQFTAPGFTDNLSIAFPDFYKNAFAENGKRVFPKGEDVIAFLDQQKDLYDEVSWGVMSHFDLSAKYNNYFLQNIAKYRTLYGNPDVEDKLNRILYTDLQIASKEKDEKKLNEVLALVTQYVTENKEITAISYRITFFKTIKNWDKCAAAMDEFFKVGKDWSTDYINSLSWDMYEGCDDKKLLKRAAAWMDKAVKKEPKYAYMDTYASLLYKSGQLKEAQAWATKAVATGKKAGEDTKSTEELLMKMKAGK